MKPFPAGLDVLLGTRRFVFCDLYSIDLVGGPTLYYTTGAIDVLSGGNLYSSRWLFVDEEGNRSTAHWKLGLDVDNWVVHMMPAPVDPVTGVPYPAQIMGQPWLAAAQAGVLDGATVQIDRAYWAAWPTVSYPYVAQYVLPKLFMGRVAAVDVMRQKAIITVNSHLELLTTAMPRNLFQAPCRHTLFDAGCTLAQASFALAGNIVTVPGQSTLTSAIAGGIPGSGTGALGQLLWTSGANAGFRRGIRSSTPIAGGYWVMQLIAPMYFPVGLGDAFTLYPGCDKQFSTCGLFGNQPNFGGQPTIPAPETAI
jgi:uncharacterized phage protein (TIGR02218 family)